MGFFDKIKGIVNGVKEQAAQRQEEEKRRQEEERRKREEANRFNPADKKLEWFGSEDGIQTFNMYMTAQNYLFEETVKKEHEASEYSKYSLDNYATVFHKGAKLPFVYFKKLVDSIDVQALEYVGPTNLLCKVLSLQAKPFYLDDDGEPQTVTPDFTPEAIVSVVKNPALNFVKNFNCFELKDDAQGTWDDKYALWSSILVWIGIYGGSDKEIVSENPWIFSKELYLNELGTVRKTKGFFKKCIELTTNEEYKAYFEKKYNEC